jgi:hypothetical protein
MTSITCAAIRVSSWPVGAFPIAAPICALSPRFRAGRTRLTLREVMSLTYAMVDLYCASYVRPPRAVALDIDDTVDIVQESRIDAEAKAAQDGWPLLIDCPPALPVNS